MTVRLSRSLQFFDNSATELNASTNKYLLKYNASTGDFDLISPDSLLAASADDGNVPDEIVTQLETQIDPTKVTVQSYDGGSF